MLFDKVWTHLNTFVCRLAHLSVFVTKQMLNLSYICTAFVHICLRQQMHHYPICLKDKCLICALHKCEQIWQILYLDHICPTFISFQICFFIQCTVGPNHPSNGVLRLNLRIFYISFHFLTKFQIVDQMILSFCLTRNAKLWRHSGWRHQNGLNVVFNFKVKLISSERVLQEEENRENRLSTTHKTRVKGLQKNWVHPPEPYLP